jgi:hypothetical protein
MEMVFFRDGEYNIKRGGPKKTPFKKGYNAIEP